MHADIQGRSSIPGQLTVEQAERVAAAIAKLPTLLSGEGAELPDVPDGPWSAKDDRDCFHVVSASGYAIATVYFNDPRAGDLTRDEARRIAAGVARLGSPEV